MYAQANVYSCGICQKNCDELVVGCVQCEKFFHQNCEGLSREYLSYLQKCVLPYLCSKCCANENEAFDYDKSLGRLEEALKSGSLDMGVRMETIFMRAISKRIQPRQISTFKNKMKKDNVASHLLGKSDLIPATVRGNGNCLFNALSLAIQGDEKLSTEIRVRTFLEMYYHKQYSSPS